MPTHQQITAAREKAKRIRECAASFRRERVRLEESTKDIRRTMSTTPASEFISAEVL
jgi:hypothetical protein